MFQVVSWNGDLLHQVNVKYASICYVPKAPCSYFVDSEGNKLYPINAKGIKRIELLQRIDQFIDDANGVVCGVFTNSEQFILISNQENKLTVGDCKIGWMNLDFMNRTIVRWLTTRKTFPKDNCRYKKDCVFHPNDQTSGRTWSISTYRADSTKKARTVIGLEKIKDPKLHLTCVAWKGTKEDPIYVLDYLNIMSTRTVANVIEYIFDSNNDLLTSIAFTLEIIKQDKDSYTKYCNTFGEKLIFGRFIDRIIMSLKQHLKRYDRKVHALILDFINHYLIKHEIMDPKIIGL